MLIDREPLFKNQRLYFQREKSEHSVISGMGRVRGPNVQYPYKHTRLELEISKDENMIKCVLDLSYPVNSSISS